MEQRIVFWNEAAERALGYPAEVTLGRRCWELIGGRDSQGQPVCCHQCSLLRRVRQGELLPNIDMIGLRRDGRHLLLNVSTLFLPAAEVRQEQEQSYLVHLFRVIGDMEALAVGLRTHLLGPTTVATSDGYVVQGDLWQRAKVRGLWAMLALHPGRRFSRLQLVDTFWGDMPPAAADHNLNTTIYGLRRSLEPRISKGSNSAYVKCEQGHYWLDNGEAHWLDVRAFENGLFRARAEKRADRAIQLYRDALSYYRGEFQSDLKAQWAWHQSVRERLRRQYVSSLGDLAQKYEQLGEREQVNLLCQQLLGLDPCDERACRSLMQEAASRGDRFTALKYYHELQQMLEQELDISPSQETQRLYQTIRDAA